MSLLEPGRSTGLVLALAAAVTGCAPGDVSQGHEADESVSVQSDFVVTFNGLTTLNGMKGPSGLRDVCRLELSNGLTNAGNGLFNLNGLATVGGATTVTVAGKNKYVNCHGVSATNCHGRPDGLLSATTGLMKDPEGVAAAKYLIECALPSNKYIDIYAHDNTRTSMKGLIGLSPSWQTGHCDAVCQEKITACMLSRVNGKGTTRDVELSAAWVMSGKPQGYPLGTDHTNSNVVESAFFGNIFLSPPQAFVVSGFDHAAWLAGVEDGSIIETKSLALRYCSGNPEVYTVPDFLATLANCPFQHVGTMASAAKSWDQAAADPTQHSKCTLVSPDPAPYPERATAGSCSGPGTSVRTWHYPITSRRYLFPWSCEWPGTCVSTSGS